MQMEASKRVEIIFSCLNAIAFVFTMATKLTKQALLHANAFYALKIATSVAHAQILNHEFRIVQQRTQAAIVPTKQ